MPDLPQLAATSNSPTTRSTKPHHPRRFDQATYNQLTALDGRLLEQIDYDSRCQAKKSPTGARYSVKPEAYFAKCLGVRRETISDHVRKLEQLGILDITRRPPKNGTWQTNLYKIISWVWWRLGKILRNLRGKKRRVTQSAHIPISMRERIPEERQKGAAPPIKGTLTALFLRIKAGEKIAD